MPTGKIKSSYFTLETLADGVYAAIAKKGEGAMGNSGIIDIGKEVVIFDTFTTPNAARELRQLAEDITQKGVKYVLNSHYHGDHTFGNQIFEDVIIISTTKTRNLHMDKNMILDPNKEMEETKKYLNQLEARLEEELNPILRTSLEIQLKEMKKVHESIPELQIVLPNLTFENRLVLHGETRTVEFCCFGGGHTPSDAFLYLPEEKIAFMGDIVLENLHPPIYNSQEFINNLIKISELDIQRIVPGHGNLVTKSQIDLMLDYLHQLNAKVGHALEKGNTLEQILAFETPEEYSTWTGIDGYKRNLNTVYNELR
ncbi:MBL fold metallo-hydrolase [Fredinandcohnia humi]